MGFARSRSPEARIRSWGLRGTGQSWRTRSRHMISEPFGRLGCKCLGYLAIEVLHNTVSRLCQQHPRRPLSRRPTRCAEALISAIEGYRGAVRPPQCTGTHPRRANHLRNDITDHDAFRNAGASSRITSESSGMEIVPAISSFSTSICRRGSFFAFRRTFFRAARV